jgi:hypothetical protein
MAAWLDRDRKLVLAVAAAIVALHLAFATQYGWFRDELYYVACGDRLTWGYVDHPPLVAVFARLAKVLFGDSLLGLRMFAMLAAGGGVVLAGEMARAAGGKRVAQLVAALAMAVAPYNLVVGHIYTMNAFEPLIWGGIGLVVLCALRDDDAKRLVWLGPIVGLGVLNKHSAGWPALALVIAIALSPSRRLLVTRETIIAALVASALAAPHVVWQVRNGFPTREFARAALSGKNEPYSVIGFIGQEAQLLHPFFAPLLFAGLVGLLVSPSLRRHRPLGIAWLLVAALIILVQAKAYYLAPAAMWLFAAGGVVLERAIASRPRVRIGAAIYNALAIATGLALAPIAMPLLPVATFQPYARSLGVLGEQRTGERVRPAALPQLYADMFGWPEMARAVEQAVIEKLEPDERVNALIFAHNYGEASAIEHFGHSLPPVASGNTGWWLFGLPRPSPQVVIAVGDVDRDLLDELFEDVREVARFDHPLVRAIEHDIPIFVCRRPKAPFESAWPRLKLYH